MDAGWWKRHEDIAMAQMAYQPGKKNPIGGNVWSGSLPICRQKEPIYWRKKNIMWVEFYIETDLTCFDHLQQVT
jgi:hypothetical protein